MVIALVTPIGSNFLQDWPEQNAINCDIVDAYAGPCLVTHPLGVYTPQLKGSTTDPVLGTGGFIHGYYYRIWDQIYTWGELRWGTAGTSAGSGNFSITLPFAADPTIGFNAVFGRGSAIGNALIYDDSNVAGTHPCTIQIITATDMQFNLNMNSGFANSIVGSAQAWTINDGMLWQARYKRAP